MEGNGGKSGGFNPFSFLSGAPSVSPSSSSSAAGRQFLDFNSPFVQMGSGAQRGTGFSRTAIIAGAVVIGGAIVFANR